MTDILVGRTKAVHFLDGAFLEGRAPRFKDLELEMVADCDSHVVTLLFSNELSFLALLPCEARQLADSLSQLADTLDPQEDEAAS